MFEKLYRGQTCVNLSVTLLSHFRGGGGRMPMPPLDETMTTLHLKQTNMPKHTRRERERERAYFG